MKFKLAFKVSADPVTAAGVFLVPLRSKVEILRTMAKAGEHMESALAQSLPMVSPTS